MFDLAIIGGGTAGLTAAIYGARAGLKFVVLEQDGYGGGQIMSAHEVENYPGKYRTSGVDLGEAFRAQAEALGAEIRRAVVKSVLDHGGYQEIVLEKGDPILARTVIAATGASPRKLGIPGEEELTGRGVSYCAVCDGGFFAEKEVLVIGGGDTAVEDAVYLASICRSVTVALRRDVFRAAKIRVDLLKEKPNVAILYNTNLREIKGRSRVETVVLEREGQRTERPMDGVFIAVGANPNTEYLSELPLSFEQGYVSADETCVTNVPGLFVAGDIRKKQLRQVVTAAADGANAVASAVEWLNRLT